MHPFRSSLHQQSGLSPYVCTNLRLSPLFARIWLCRSHVCHTFNKGYTRHIGGGGVPPSTRNPGSPHPSSGNPPTPGSGFEVIDPTWLLKAIGFTLIAALVCGYLTLCLLFYQGQWQLVLHPGPSSTALSTLAGLPAQPIRFDATETGNPRLSGALIPASPDARYAAYTVLYLRSGESSLAADPADARNLNTLHTLGLTIFAFDYRGYGQSDPPHPNQVRMAEDAAATLRYLTETRATPPSRLVLFGSGVGGSLATSLAAAHPQIPALIVDNPGPSPIGLALTDPRTRLLPVRALFHESFSLAPLATLATPKLLISDSAAGSAVPPSFSAAASPKITLELQTSDAASTAAIGIDRFLDQTLPHAARTLME